MRNLLRFMFAVTLSGVVLFLTSVAAQERAGSISGKVTDNSQAALRGAEIQLQPSGQKAVSGDTGEFTMPGVAPGHYTLTVSYVGFNSFSTEVNVASGQATSVDAVLQVEKVMEQVTVTSGRQFGEVEAINRERVADNILQVLPAEVITSLPNTNIADAVGRMPSVSLERDEGEGKYIQIRGTEPRLSNVTIDGVHTPSPEGIRNVKLDVIPADLIDSVEISKTLSANQDADAIGGSVNIVTKSAADKPYYGIGTLGGFTPIDNVRRQYEVDGTFGQRFGAKKRFGLMISGSWDYNARGINDIEPSPAVNPIVDANGNPTGSTVNGPNSNTVREYIYDRKRYGFSGGLDYKLGDMSSIYLKGLYSNFHDFGENWNSVPILGNFTSPTTTDNTGSVLFQDVHRIPQQQIWSFQTGARHLFGTYVLTWEVALSQARGFQDFPNVVFNGPTGVSFGLDTTNPFIPKFPVLNGVNINDPTLYSVASFSFTHLPNFDRDIEGAVSLSKQYSKNSHYGTFEVGLKYYDSHPTELYNFNGAVPAPGTAPVLISSFLSTYTNHNYYFGDYQLGPLSDYGKLLAFYNANKNLFITTFNSDRSYSNTFNIHERIPAGYVMNTISFGRLRLQTGVRFEATTDKVDALNFVAGDPNDAKPITSNHSYVNVFPSVQAQYNLTPSTVLRAAYGAGISRPNPGDLSPFVLDNPTAPQPPRISAGNPNLKPEHAQNFDLLVERYFQGVGLIQGGMFYKYLTGPIFPVNITRPATDAQFPGQLESTSINGSQAHVGGVEASWQQQLKFLPGLLNGMGVRANYSYTTSRASFPSSTVPARTDRPALIRQGPGNWNFDATYDKKGISARMGLSHNDAYIDAYNFFDGAPGGIRGPNGDNYIYPHTQVDAQVSYLLPRGHGLRVVASFLNLNNEVFGFYNGSEQYPVQREYYRPAYSFGLRWIPSVKGDTNVNLD